MAPSEELHGFQRNEAWLESISSLQDFRWSETASLCQGLQENCRCQETHPPLSASLDVTWRQNLPIWPWRHVLPPPEGLSRPEQSCPGKSNTGNGGSHTALRATCQNTSAIASDGHPRDSRDGWSGMAAEAAAELAQSLQAKRSDVTIQPPSAPSNHKDRQSHTVGRRQHSPTRGKVRPISGYVE